MALTLLASPGNDVSVNNEMLFVLQESVKTADPVTYPNYKFVLDVYVDGVMKGRLIAFPDPTTSLGIFNVANILRSYASHTFKANYSNETENHSPFITYTVKAGEEYDGTIYTNILVDGSNRYAVESYKRRPFTSSTVLQDAAFASNQPDTIYTFKDAKWLLLNYYEDSYPGATENIDFAFYDSAGTLIDIRTYSNQTVTAKNFLQMNVSWQKIESEFTTMPELRDGTVYYTITVNGVVKIIRLLCDKYDSMTLAWLNPYGAYESYQFGFVSRKDIQTEGKSYGRLPYNIDPSGNVSYKSDGVFYGGRRKFSSNVKTKMKLTSHILNADEYTWLADLFVSPDVYLYDADLDAFVPVVISETNYEYRNYLNSRVKPLEFSVEFSDDYNGQYL